MSRWEHTARVWAFIFWWQRLKKRLGIDSEAQLAESRPIGGPGREPPRERLVPENYRSVWPGGKDWWLIYTVREGGFYHAQTCELKDYQTAIDTGLIGGKRVFYVALARAADDFDLVLGRSRDSVSPQ